MQTFIAKRWDEVEYPANSWGGTRAHGIRAPGRIVMVVREGSGWVLLQDGTRENLTATSVVTWEPGEWVEYGADAGEGWKTESYWAEDLSDDEWKAVFAEAFGPDAVTDWDT
jgi:hypothetical protein